MAIGSPDLAGQGEVSEWVEQQGRDWEQKFGLQADDEDGLGAYFALSVTAAGWHSGALVLVNEDLAQKISKACEMPESKAAEASNVDTESNTPDAPEPSSEAQPIDDSNNNVSLLQRTLTTALDYGRWFLGVGPYSAQSSNTSNQDNNIHPLHPDAHPSTSNNARQAPNPVDYGASPRDGVAYVWARDHFPRLRLSDGREMPGEVDFDEWRYGRPEWDLDFRL